MESRSVKTWCAGAFFFLGGEGAAALSPTEDARFFFGAAAFFAFGFFSMTFSVSSVVTLVFLFLGEDATATGNFFLLPFTLSIAGSVSSSVVVVAAGFTDLRGLLRRRSGELAVVLASSPSSSGGDMAKKTSGRVNPQEYVLRCGRLSPGV
jgi:hypothetical protein